MIKIKLDYILSERFRYPDLPVRYKTAIFFLLSINNNTPLMKERGIDFINKKAFYRFLDG